MPGVHVAPRAIPASVEFTEAYSSRTVTDDDGAFGYTRHPAYPVTHLSGDGYEAILDGLIYDAPVTEQDIVELMLERDLGALRDVVPSLDGSFVLVVYDEASGTYLGLNDAFARLPLYYLDDEVALSREPALLVNYLDAPEFDPVAVAQMLVFRYPLGQRTPFEAVSTLPPGSFFTLDETVTVQSTYEHDFESYRAGQSATLDQLRSLFRQACENRCLDRYRSLLSLSGGMDSRAVAAGYHDTCPGTEAVSFTTGDGASAKDADLAGRIADALGMAHDVFPVDGGSRYRRLQLEMMGGMNSVHMAPQLEFVEAVAERWDRPFVVTGDGGDKLFPDLTPSPTFDDVDHLADWIVREHEVLEPDVAEDVTGVSRERLLETVVAELSSYPETSLTDAYVHFLFRNRGFNWLNVGEDRSRHFVWSDTPFYSMPLFEAAMSVPPSTKAETDYYTRFIAGLSEAVTAVPDATYNAPIDSLEYQAKRKAFDALGTVPRLNRLVSWMARLKLDRFDASLEIPDEIADELDSDVEEIEKYTLSSAMDLYTLEKIANEVDTSVVRTSPAE